MIPLIQAIWEYGGVLIAIPTVLVILFVFGAVGGWLFDIDGHDRMPYS